VVVSCGAGPAGCNALAGVSSNRQTHGTNWGRLPAYLLPRLSNAPRGKCGKGEILIRTAPERSDGSRRRVATVFLSSPLPCFCSIRNRGRLHRQASANWYDDDKLETGPWSTVGSNRQLPSLPLILSSLCSRHTSFSGALSKQERGAFHEIKNRCG
jgi:hypothetical protein